jgi:hypothetical protein
VLKAVAALNDMATNIATYADPSLPLAPDVVKSIVDFVRTHKGMDWLRPDANG